MKCREVGRFVFRPQPRFYESAVKQKQSHYPEAIYGPPNRSRFISTNGDVDGLSCFHTTRNLTPKGGSLLNSPRATVRIFQTKSVQELIDAIPNNRIRVGCLELAYLLQRDRQPVQEIRASFASLIEKVGQELTKLGKTLSTDQERLPLLSKSPQVSDAPPEDKPARVTSKNPSRSEYEPLQQQNRAQLQNAKLAATNRILALRVKELTQQLSAAALSSPVFEPPKLSQEQLEALDRCHYLQIKRSNEQKRVESMTGELQTLKATVGAAQAVAAQKLNEMEEMVNLTAVWRERAMMLSEDLQARRQRQQFMLSYVRRISKDRRGTSQHHDAEQPSVKVALRNETFRSELKVIQDVRKCSEQAKGLQYRQQLKYKNDDLGAEVGNLEYEITALRARRHEEAQLSQLSYWRPTFYNLIEHIPLEPQARRNSQISRQFVQKLRGIMNCKLSEFLLGESNTYTRFPEFVLSWLELYDFEPSTGEVVQRPSGQPSQARRFYADLMNLKLDQTWEVISFREFLLEELSLEELYFYLMCQNVLYRRAAITRERQYFGELAILVELSIARAVVYTIMSEFDSTNIEYILEKLAERAMVRRGKQLIDCGFILRCLLECYKVERLNRYRFISKVCKEQLAAEDINDRFTTGKLDFAKTLKIFGLFQGISYPTKVMLYRECVSVSRGAITPEVIFTVLTEHNVFLDSLRVRSFYRLPMLLKGSEDCSTVQPSFSYLPPVFQQLRDLLAVGSDFSQCVNSLGVDSINQKIQTYRRYFLQKKLYSDNCIMRCKHFLHFLSEVAQRIRQINCHQLYDVLEDVDRRASGFSVEIDENTLGEMSLGCLKAILHQSAKTRELIQWKAKVRSFRATVAARKIQRYIREKFIRPYVQLYNNMLSKARNALHQHMSSTVPSKAFQELKKAGGRNISLASKPRKNN